MGILPGTDGEIKMSKSLGNHIPIMASPEDMYGKVMSVPDKAMGDYFRMVTRWTPAEIEKIEAGLTSGKMHPRDVKMNLAHEIVEIFYSDEEADRAQSEFIKVFQQKDIPEEMKEFPFNSDKTVLDVLVETGLVSSKSEGRRLTSQNGVRLDGDVITDANINFPHPGVLQVGKRRFVRVA